MPVESKTVFDIAALEPHQAYKLGTGLIVPRPIGWIGTADTEDRPNLAPYSFFNMVAPYPPTFVVAPLLGARKDTLANLESTGEFTVNVVTEETMEAMNQTAASVDPEVDEFELLGLTAVRSETVTAPMVGEATANFECVVTNMVPVGRATDHAPGTAMLVVGEATRVHVAERVIDDAFNVNQQELRAIGRHVGGMYSRTAASIFSIERPA